MRLIKTCTSKTGKTAKVYRNTDWDEYVVRFYNHLGTHMDASDYHTNTLAYTINTATLAINKENMI